MIKMRERENNNVHCVHVYYLPLSRLKKGGNYGIVESVLGF